MASGFVYVPKIGQIYVVTLTTAGTWYQILTSAQAKAIRGLKISARQAYDSDGLPTHSPRPFAIANNASPDETGAVSDGTGMFTISNGIGDTFGPSNGLYAKGFKNATVLEIMTFG